MFMALRLRRHKRLAASTPAMAVLATAPSAGAVRRQVRAASGATLQAFRQLVRRLLAGRLLVTVNERYLLARHRLNLRKLATAHTTKELRTCLSRIRATVLQLLAEISLRYHQYGNDKTMVFV
jgi:hypothetical protein